MLILFCWQLRVVRAFKSTLEDLEEKRSVHSFHSLHSIRSSRSHQGPRTISEEANSHHEKFLRTPPPDLNSPQSPDYASPHCDQPFKLKSLSYENVPLVSKQPSPIMASTNPAHKASPPKTLSHSDIVGARHETTIWLADRLLPSLAPPPMAHGLNIVKWDCRHCCREPVLVGPWRANMDVLSSTRVTERFQSDSLW